MGKELIDKKTIEYKAKYFWQYLEDISQKEIINFIENLSEFSHVFIFSGVIRNFFLNIDENARDIDIVYQGNDDKLRQFLKGYKHSVNSFNGYKIYISNYSIDLWKIDSTWAIENRKLNIELFNQYVLPESAFFNFSSIVYDIYNKKFIYSEKFIEFINSRTLDLVLWDNPLPQLCIVNTLYYKEKFDLKISESLKEFCSFYFEKFNDKDFNAIQLKHFKEVKFSYSYIKKHIEVFNNKLKSLLFDLELLDKNELFFLDDLNDENKTQFLNSRTREILSNQILPDAFFCIKGEPLILFFDELKIAKEEDWQVKIWNFNQSAVIFINENKQWSIKNGFKILENGSALEDLNEGKLTDFEYFELISGKCWDKHKKSFAQENRVDYYLLNNISAFRNKLTIVNKLDSKIANALIGRAIFVRYLIDRGIDLDRYRIKDQKDFNDILLNKIEAYKLFNKILADFKGNLFPLSYIVNGKIINEEDEVSQEQLTDLTHLLQGAKIIKGTIQLAWENLYDFSIIPIEFISSIYERFIGEENQADKGAYYTPLFLVDYIEKETVGNFFKSNPSQENCKILDPSCGSGIFLVEGFRIIINQYKKINPDYNKDENKISYRDKIVDLLKTNIFGIDQDENAINIAIFSLYITLLDNIEPKSINGFEFPELLDTNFFVSDFFNTKDIFNTKLSQHSFQFILGNPPWKTKGHPKAKQLFEKYIEDRKEKENSKLEIIHREIAEAFLIRVSDFNFVETAFIVVSKILYKLDKNGVFRNYFFNNFQIRQIVELSSVRHQIFNNSNDSAVAPATILFYKKEKKFDDNIIKHISLKPNIFFEVFKLMVIEKYDVKEISQKIIINEDWVLKTLVYGNILDYHFIKRLKDNYSTIKTVISDKSKFAFGQGLKFKDGQKKINTSKFVNYNFLGSLKKKLNKKGEEADEQTNYNDYLKSYYIPEENFIKWDSREVGYFPEDSRIFNAPTLLITGGTSKEFRSVSGISYRDTLFKSSLTAVKALNNDYLNSLKTFSAILNSSFFSYYIIITGSSIGIEREETHDEEKWNVPFNESQALVEIYKNVEKLSKDYYNAFIKDPSVKYQLDESINKLDLEVINLFQPSHKEKSLIDYTVNITTTLLKGNKEEKRKIISKIKFKDDILKKYAEVFTNHFINRFNANNNYFEVEILWSEFLIMMKFKIISHPSKEKNSIVWSRLDNKQLLINIIQLGFENISDNLFLQKDIKGFEEDFFYIAKPNQYKSWHSALAHLDLSEFIEAFFKINSESLNENK